MYIEKRYMKKIGKVFEALSIPLRLVDASGACLVPEDGEPASLPAGVLAQELNHHAGRYFSAFWTCIRPCISLPLKARPARRMCCAWPTP